MTEISGRRTSPVRALRDDTCGRAAGSWHDGRRRWTGRGGGWV